jgi:hypothetical protein
LFQQGTQPTAIPLSGRPISEVSIYSLIAYYVNPITVDAPLIAQFFTPETVLGIVKAILILFGALYCTRKIKLRLTKRGFYFSYKG